MWSPIHFGSKFFCKTITILDVIKLLKTCPHSFSVIDHVLFKDELPCILIKDLTYLLLTKKGKKDPSRCICILTVCLNWPRNFFKNTILTQYCSCGRTNIVRIWPFIPGDKKNTSPDNIIDPNGPFYSVSFSILGWSFPLTTTTLTGPSATNPRHVISAVLSWRTHWVSSEGGPVLQLGGEELQAAGSCRYHLPWCRQARHPTLDPVGTVALPSHVHGVALRPLLRGEGGGIAQAVMIRLMWGRQSVSGRHPCSSWV